MHYSSVISRMNNDNVYKTMTCPTHSQAKPGRPFRDEWYDDHNEDWRKGWMQQKNLRCQADEYPPAAFWQGRKSPKQFIRFAPGGQNGGAGSMFKIEKTCKYLANGQLPISRKNEKYVGDRVIGNLVRQVTQYTAVTTIRKVVIDFDNDVQNLDGDWGLEANPCWPKKLLHDPGFALLLTDPYYAGSRDAQKYAKDNYGGLVPQDVLDTAANNGYKNLAGFSKRDGKHALDPDAWVYDEGNSTRPATDEELEEYIGIVRCASADCKEEMETLQVESAMVVQPSGLFSSIVHSSVVAVAAVATPTGFVGLEAEESVVGSAGSGLGSTVSAQLPQATAFGI
jgi:chitinase